MSLWILIPGLLCLVFFMIAIYVAIVDSDVGALGIALIFSLVVMFCAGATYLLFTPERKIDTLESEYKIKELKRVDRNIYVGYNTDDELCTYILEYNDKLRQVACGK